MPLFAVGDIGDVGDIGAWRQVSKSVFMSPTRCGYYCLCSQATEAALSATPVIYQLGLDARRGNGTDNANDSMGVTLTTADIRSMSRQLRSYLAGGFRPANESVILFARSGRGTLGVYMGRGLDNARTGRSALRVLEAALQQSNASSSVAVQLCNDDPAAGGDHDYIFGVMAASDSHFGLVQTALQTWYTGSCMAADTFSGGVTNYSSDAVYLSPPPSVVTAGNTTSTIGNGTIKYDTSGNHTYTPAARHIVPRANCRTRDVVDGDSCEKLAVKCGISGPDFTRFNPDTTLCSTLKPGMHVCCSEGTRPNYRPSRNADGTCAVHKIGQGETCTSLAAAFDVKIEEIERWNRRTWMFNGCNQYLAYQGLLCLSDGDPPMPEAVDGAQCGPTMPGTPRQPASVDLNTVNPCPINACCDIWGSCGTSAEYCTDTHVTSAPGSAAPNTAGCISNCGVDLVQSAPPKQFLSVGYYEGYHFDRPCLYQDPTQIDTSKFTHLHYAFATIEAGNYTITTGDNAASYTFMEFRRLTGVKRIVSLGGWGFSTSPNTYDIFRQGVKPGNRETLAANVARFVTEHGLDGVDFDWEYPGTYDIPGIPPPFDGKDEGPNYLEFLKLVRKLLPDKSISIAVSSSYWNLRNFPIADMGRVVDYVVYMTYDLHGQWDAATKWSQPGCGDGKCLWSHVNLTETMSSLVMVTKAGVPSNKIVVGVSSYGRSFNMADGACWTETCKYTGTATQSDATPGVCTGVRGYIANAEIKQILADPRRVRTSYHDYGSDSNILVYDTNQWVSYMDSSVRAARTQRYRQLNMGGVANWAIDLEDYNDKPPSRDHGDDGGLGDSSWDGFILGIRVNGAKSASGDGYHGQRTGNWVGIQCDNDAVSKQSCKSGEQRWDMLDADHAWSDVLATWNTNRSDSQKLSVHISDILNGVEASNCGALENSNCNDIVRCYTNPHVGAAAYAVWNSLVEIHQMFDNFHKLLTGPVYHTVVDIALKDFEDAFAPVIPAENTAWVDILFAIVSLGATAAAAPFFNTILAGIPYFARNPHAADNIKDSTYALIASGAIISGTELKTAKGLAIWDAAAQAQFREYIGEALVAWDNATAYALDSLMKGTADSLDRLTTLVSHGKMLCSAVDPDAPCHEGNPEKCPIDNSADAADALAKNITRLVFASALPNLWRVSGLRPFVLNTGFPCNTVDPLPDYMSAATMHATYGCYQDRLYYLVMPNPKSAAVHCDQPLCNLGSCSPADCHHVPFEPPTGLDHLTPGNKWGNLSRDHLIRGAVRTYQKNNNQNDDNPPDLSNRDTMMDLLGTDYTTPGVIRIPVCSADMAFKAWDLGLSPLTTPHYLCAPPPLTASNCGASSFVDQTSNASPPVGDCLQIVNIEGTKGDYPVYADQQAVLSAGLCVFGVQVLRDKKDPKGPVMTRIANQDAVDLIRDAAARFGGSGRLGAKGTMKCGDYTIEWGIYHTK